MDVIAEERLDVKYPDEGIVPVHLRIGRPRSDSEGQWGCEVQAEGLRVWEGPKVFHGEGSLQALMIASSFLDRMLTFEIEGGAIVIDQADSEPIDLDLLFIFPNIRNDK